MNTEQWQSIIRSAITVIGGMLVTKGIVSAADAPGLETALVSLAGVLLTAAPTIWGAFSHSHTAIIAVVNSDSVPGVKVVAVSSPSPQVDAPIAPATSK